MKKTEIFEEIVRIMKYDAASCKEEKGGDVEFYRAKISEDMKPKEFMFVMDTYLATFHVEGHVNFWWKHRGRLDFDVQRYKDELYVVKTLLNSKVSVGDKITRIDGYTVKEFGKLHKELLYGESEERQGIFWKNILAYADRINVVKADTGEEVLYEIELHKTESKSENYYCRTIDDNIVFMRLKDFGNEEQIQKMYDNHDELLRTTDFLIIDVRGNGGGSSTAWMPLIKFCFPKKEGIEKDIYDYGREVNYTERNCDLRLRLLEDYKKADLPERTLQIINSMERDLKEKRGMGFVKEEEDFDFQISGSEIPKKVYIITDTGCGSAGETFVQLMKKSSKVTVVGRHTTGVIDYSNCIIKYYDDFGFIYPTERELYLDHGLSLRKKGISPDVYIPWTPEHLGRDVELETILEMIKKESL